MSATNTPESAASPHLADATTVDAMAAHMEENNSDTHDVASVVVDRRSFVRLAVGSAAALGVGATTAFSQVRGGGAGGAAGGAAAGGRAGGAAQQALPPLGNGEHPALVFQAYPGGTGALMEKLVQERGAAAFQRTPIAIEPWTGTVPTAEEDVVFLPVSRLAALVQSRRISSVDLTRMYLERMKRLNPVLLCAVTILESRAMEEAQQADAEIRAGNYRGPLHGIPYGVKDLFSTKGSPTTWGAGSFENRVIDEDAEVVVRLRQAGAVLIAKLATGRFAQGDPWFRGRTRNPWNTEAGSSGSSAGPGSATAAACVAFSIGTETQGSIVSPTTVCGINALRPTFGRVSRHGGMVLAWSMDKAGPMCRSIQDCALVFNAIHGADAKDPSSLTTPFQWEPSVDLSKLTIGYVESAGGGGGGRGGRGGTAEQQEAARITQEERQKDYDAMLNTLRSGGARLVPVGARPRQLYSSALNIEDAVAFDFFADSLITNATDSAQKASRFSNGRDDLALDFLQSQRHRLKLMHEMAEFMKGMDMYVVPGGDIGLTNQTGHPAAVFPYRMGTGANPQPEVINIIGDLFADDRILSVAHAFQKTTDYHTRRPKLA